MFYVIGESRVVFKTGKKEPSFTLFRVPMGQDCLQIAVEITAPCGFITQ